ncbi:hypothetical protein QYE76_039687 [Lolium multiflorum]|uniref:Uncharacterized protein n=1 Tax=Lolium multiflorum TaxID=4521 RepID=A0AAD8TBM0_LOLMU|nr:hypothetical protein QYE76_039687 [Lolium multiflorum]
MTRAQVKALHDEVNSLLTTLDLGTPLDGLLPHADVLCVIRYKAHQDPGEEDTPRSGEGEEQRDMEMITKPNPTSLEALKGREEVLAGPGPGQTGPTTGPSGPRPGQPEATGFPCIVPEDDRKLRKNPTGPAGPAAGQPGANRIRRSRTRSNRIQTGRIFAPSSELDFGYHHHHHHHHRRNGDDSRDGEVLRNTERLATQHNLRTQRQEFKEQLALFETRIDEQYDEVAHNFSAVNQDLDLLREATDNLNGQMEANDANMEWRMDSLERAITNLGMKTIIDPIAHMFVMKTLAPTLGAEKSIAMLVHMSGLHKTKSYNKIVTKRIAMPTMGVTTNPKTKVLKIHLGVISDATLAMTNVDEESHTMIKMRGPTLSIVNNLDKIFNHILTVNQVKQVFTFNANPMLWLAVEDLLFLL